MSTTSSSNSPCSTTIQVDKDDGGHVDPACSRKLLKKVNNIAFYVALFEWAGNALGTLAFLWATVVMLGGFCSLLSRMDFWFSTVMVFMEGTRVFIRNDASLNQWLFGSTRAFRWEDFSFPRMLVKPSVGNLIALSLGVSISGLTITFRPEIVGSILKLAILVVISQMLSRLKGKAAKVILVILLIVAFLSIFCYSLIKSAARGTKVTKFDRRLIGFAIAGSFAASFLLIAVAKVWGYVLSKKPGAKRWIKVIAALVLPCVPLFQLILVGTLYRYFSMGVAAVLLLLSTATSTVGPLAFLNQIMTLQIAGTPPPPSLNQMPWQIVDTILPILCYWSVMFPLPGIPLTISFFILFFVISAVLVGNLQIPVALLQVALSIMRLHSLLGHNHLHRNYQPLPDGASPNLVPSIVVFFSLELCQGSSYILGILLDLFSLFRYRRPLVSALGLTREEEEEWGAKAVNLYHHQAYKTWKEKGLFPAEKEKYTPPSLDSFAIESLGCSSSEMQIVRLHVLDYYLEQEDSESKKKLIPQIAKDATDIITKIIAIISHLITSEENSTKDENTTEDENSTDDENNSGEEYSSGDKEEREKTRSSLSLSLKFVRRLAITGGKIGTRFRWELLENPILLNSLERILDFKDCKPELWKPAMDVKTILALDEATGQEIGNNKYVIDNDGSLREVAKKVLANLTIMSIDNCWVAIVKAGNGHAIIKKLINMLEDDECISIAANLLHNLSALSRDMLISLGVQEDPKSTLQTVLAQKLELDTGAAAAKLIEKLVNPLKSERVLHSEYLRRVLVWVIIYIVESCPGYKRIFRENGAENALDTLKTMFLESAPMGELVDKAKRLIMAVEATPTQGAQPNDHGL